MASGSFTHIASSLSEAAAERNNAGDRTFTSMDPATTPATVQRRRWPFVVGGIALLLIVLILIFDWNWFKGPIERRVTAATGREFHIGGDLDVDLGFTTKVRASDIEFANAPWSKHAQMFELKRIEARIKVMPLLHGEVDLAFIDVDGPRLLVERNAQGKGNWVFEPKTSPEKSDEPVKLPLIREIRVRNGEFQLIEPVYQTNLRLAIRSGTRSSKDARAPLLADGKGTYRGGAFELSARVDSPLEFQNAERPFRIDLRASAGDTHAHVSGALLGQLQFEHFKVQTEASGANLADLYELLGVALPETPPYKLSGELDREGNVWSYREFKGQIGHSDMSGKVALELPQGTRTRMKLTGDLVSQKLDFADLGAAIGAPPAGKEGETLSKEQQVLVAQRASNPRVLPDSAFNLEKLRVMDADVKLKATRIDSHKLPLEQMDVHILLDDGVLRLDPLNFNTAGGVLATRIELDAREASIKTTATGEVKGLQLSKLFPKIELTKRSAGDLSGAIALTAQGNSVAQMLGSANGNIGLIMGEGHISNLLVEVAGLDIAEALKYLIDKDREIPLRCAFAAFDIQDGVMTTKGLAFDTTDTAIFGEGKVDMHAEAIQMRLLPQPKDRSPLTLRVPLKIGGTFKDPSFSPEAGPLILRGAAAAALYSIAPPAALLALIETGPGKNIDCSPAAALPKGEPEKGSAQKPTKAPANKKAT
ncbi:MAG: AsmA family protein [Steroidobacteraceae bacterium]